MQKVYFFKKQKLQTWRNCYLRRNYPSHRYTRSLFQYVQQAARDDPHVRCINDGWDCNVAGVMSLDRIFLKHHFAWSNFIIHSFAYLFFEGNNSCIGPKCFITWFMPIPPSTMQRACCIFDLKKTAAEWVVLPVLKKMFAVVKSFRHGSGFRKKLWPLIRHEK